MAEYRITIGDIDAPDYEFDNDTIVSGSMSYSTAVDLVGTELSVDIFTATVEYYVGGDLLFSPHDYNGVLTSDDYLFSTADVLGNIAEAPYGIPVVLYNDGELVGKFFLQNIVRVAATRYKINAMSAIGILEHQRHYGGIYQMVTIGDFLTEIIGNSFDYSVDPAVASETISGWLPLSNKRSNLHEVMQAMGVTLTKDENGNIKFSFLYDGDAQSVSSDRIYMNGTVNYNALASAVEVTEHSFVQLPASDPVDQLFDNIAQVPVSNLLVGFSDPHYDISASAGLTIEEFGVNYAIVSGIGTLTGKKYTHNTRTITKQAVGAVGAENIAKCDGNTMINALNSEAVANRLLAFYASRKTVSASIVNQGEKCGDKISFTNAFGEADSGFIASMDSTPSTFIKSALKIITDYVPTGGGNFYHNRAVISSSGTWLVPSGVTRIRVVLIGGGQGGQGGLNGQHGMGGDKEYGGDQVVVYNYPESLMAGYYRGTQHPASGGKAGTPGLSGKVLIFDVEITDGEVLTFTIGQGGAGGVGNGGNGADGTDTTVSSTSISPCSTADGVRVSAYYDPITGDILAATGENGYDGGDGGMTDTIDVIGYDGGDGLPGADVGDYHGGVGGRGVIDNNPPGYDEVFKTSGGGGGGAAYGANGGAGSNGDSYGSFWISGGDGGNGANATAPSAASYGTGGTGGNGGGGGGNGGGVYWWNPSRGSNSEAFASNGGAGGLGSAGGDGGDGCAIIYY